MAEHKNKLPLLDIQQYYNNRQAFVQELRTVCHKIGFFLLRHDIPPSIATQQLDETRRFFQQPLTDKLSISYEDSPSFRGFMQIGVENTAGKMDWREQIEYAAEYSNSTSDSNSWPPYQRLRAPSNPWPDDFQPTLRTATEAYLSHCRRIADCIRESLALALGQSSDFLDPLFGEGETNAEKKLNNPPHWVLKLIHYPVANQTTDSFGVGAHTDTNFLTLVLQDEIGGLQVFSQGEWIDVPANLDSVLVCNLGEQAELLSDGYFRATPHRVLANTHQPRVSVPLFYNPRLDATIKPIATPTDLPRERDEKNHWTRKSNAMLATVGENTFKSLARSHPKVFRKHHPDLEILEDGNIVANELHKNRASVKAEGLTTMTANATLLTHYEILQVPPNSSLETIKASYQQKVRKLHPDKNGGVESEEFLRLQAAWECLRSEETRKDYDSVLSKVATQQSKSQHVPWEEWELVEEEEGSLLCLLVSMWRRIVASRS